MLSEEVKEMKLYTWLTVEINDVKHIHSLVGTSLGGSNPKMGAILNSYDILAIETKTEAIFEQIVEKA